MEITQCLSILELKGNQISQKVEDDERRRDNLKEFLLVTHEYSNFLHHFL